jgi:hypothetical protein
LSCLTLFAQSSNPQQPVPGQTIKQSLPPGTIEGLKNPELIPDAAAYRLFFRAVSEPKTKTAQQAERQRAKLLALQLSVEDSQALTGALETFFDQHEILLQAYKNAALAGVNRHTDYLAQCDALVTSTRATLASRMSIDSLLKLDRIVQREKANMVIFPFPSMPGMSAK